MSLIPTDKLNFVFILFLINGIGTLLPWNALINCDKYFVEYKLNVTDATPAQKNYQANFLSYLGIASKAPNILLQLLNMFMNSVDANLARRVSITLVIQITVFLFIIGMAIIDTSSTPDLFFWLTMLAAALINLANGVYQGCVYGLAARFPMKYTNSVTTGMNMSGTLAAILMILSIAISPSFKIEAIIFFSSAVVLLLVCLIGQFFIVKNNFYNHYSSTVAKISSIKSINPGSVFEVEATIESLEKNSDDRFKGQMQLAISNAATYDGKANRKWNEKVDKSLVRMYLYVLRCIWLQLVNLVLIYFVSLSLFPAVHARIESKDNIIDQQYFTPVFCFLFFNLFATLGNFIAQFVQWPGPNYLVIFCLARLAFIPFFLYCNYIPGDVRTLPVIFHRDWHFIVAGIAMATTSGYFSSLAMMYAPKSVPPQYSTTAGMISALTIILGILIGMNFSLLYPKIIAL